MTDRYDELRAAAEAATDGDWNIRPEPPNEGQHRRLIGANIKPDGSSKHRKTLNGGVYVIETKGRDAIPNAKFCVIARRDVPALLAERDSLLAALKDIALARKIVESVKAAPGAHSMIMSDGSVVTGEPANVVMSLVASIRTICDVAIAALTTKEG